jgi:hypothetical protein
MRNEKHRTSDTQDVEFVEQVEFVGKRHSGSPRWFCLVRPPAIKIALLGV